MKSIKLIAILSLIAVSFSSGVMAQQRKIPKNPFRFSDAVTGKPIPEVLVLPRYFSAKGIFIAPEGPAKGTYRNYLDKPFVYRTGAPFILKASKPRILLGLWLVPICLAWVDSPALWPFAKLQVLVGCYRVRLCGSTLIRRKA